jgi:hypothetical protein
MTQTGKAAYFLIFRLYLQLKGTVRENKKVENEITIGNWN